MSTTYSSRRTRGGSNTSSLGGKVLTLPSGCSPKFTEFFPRQGEAEELGRRVERCIACSHHTQPMHLMSGHHRCLFDMNTSDLWRFISQNLVRLHDILSSLKVVPQLPLPPNPSAGESADSPRNSGRRAATEPHRIVPPTNANGR